MSTTASGSFLEKCGQAVTTECVGKTVPMTEAGWKRFTDDMVGAITAILKGTAMGGAGDFSFTMLRALNSLTCMVTNLGNNFWNLFGVVWYTSLEFKFDKEVTKYVAEYYPYACTCKVETDIFMKLFKATSAAMTTFGGCSEETQKEEANAKAKSTK